MIKLLKKNRISLYLLILILVCLLYLLNNIYKNNLFFTKEKFDEKEEDTLILNDDVNAKTVNLNTLNTNKEIDTKTLCIGKTCINETDLEFMYILPVKTDSKLCLGNECINKIHFEYLNKFAKPGLIVAYNGKLEDLPDFWVLCDGKNGTPDLRNKFILGAGKKYNIDDTGGKERILLKSNNIPSHSHDMKINITKNNSKYDSRCGITDDCNSGFNIKSSTETSNVSNEGLELKTDTSKNDIESVNIMPPYKSLYYIMMIDKDKK